MKLIVLRGVPGTGKTTVAKILGKIFIDSEVVSADKFKIQAMKNKKSFKKSREIAYEKTLKKLYSLHDKKKDLVILDEILDNKEFYNKLAGFIEETRCEVYWFRLMRPIERLLEEESKRKRKIKNTSEDFETLKRDTESFKIENEIWIKNDDLALTINKILDIVV